MKPQIDYSSWFPRVEYTPDLNGGGIILAPIFEKILGNKHFNVAFEWCAGPAWIGLWLLEIGVCDELVTGDINERSVNMVRKTAEKNNYNVRSYVSNNLDAIPNHEKFDLVISNPPNYSNIQLSHPFGFLRNDLRPSDINWKIHNNFYSTIRPYLHKNSKMYISEVEPYKKEVYINGNLYDSRLEIPIKDFIKMTDQNGMEIEREIPYILTGSPDLSCYILEIGLKDETPVSKSEGKKTTTVGSRPSYNQRIENG